MPIEFLFGEKETKNCWRFRREKPSARPHVSFGATPESANALLLEK